MNFIRLSDNSRYKDSWTMWARFPSAYYIIFDQFVPFIIKYFKYFLEFLYGTCNPDQNGLTGPCELFKTVPVSYFSFFREEGWNQCLLVLSSQKASAVLLNSTDSLLNNNNNNYYILSASPVSPLRKSLFKCY